MAGKIKHAFVSPVPDEGVAEEVGPNEWNASLQVSEGADGQVMVRRVSAPDGWELMNLGALLSFINATQAANSGTGETDLHTFALPTGHFNADKKAIRLKAYGSFAANANVKTLKLKFGAAGTVTLNPTTGSPNGLRFDVEVLIIRTASNVQHIYSRTHLSGAPGLFELIGRVTTAETDSGALTLKLTGQSGTASNDILLDVTEIDFLN